MKHDNALSLPHVLLVDDDELNRRLAEILLQKSGCRVECATNGIEALSALTERSFKLVLMDCNMPEMDGYEATRLYRLREADLKIPRLAIVAFTGNSSDDYQTRCLGAGMDDFLAKPYTPAEFLNKIQLWLKP